MVIVIENQVCFFLRRHLAVLFSVMPLYFLGHSSVSPLTWFHLIIIGTNAKHMRGASHHYINTSLCLCFIFLCCSLLGLPAWKWHLYMCRESKTRLQDSSRGSFTAWEGVVEWSARGSGDPDDLDSNSIVTSCEFSVTAECWKITRMPPVSSLKLYFSVFTPWGKFEGEHWPRKGHRLRLPL